MCPRTSWLAPRPPAYNTHQHHSPTPTRTHLPKRDAGVGRLDALAVGVGEVHEAGQRLLGRVGVLLLARLALLLAAALAWRVGVRTRASGSGSGGGGGWWGCGGGGATVCTTVRPAAGMGVDAGHNTDHTTLNTLPHSPSPSPPSPPSALGAFAALAFFCGGCGAWRVCDQRQARASDCGRTA
jgi:hypothetical protein